MKTAIIGCGPGGAGAAIQLKKFDIEPVVFERCMIGGLARNAWRINNYLGFPDGIPGEKFCKLMEEQLRKFDIEIRHEDVKLLDYGDPFTIETNKGCYSFDVVIVASGTKPRMSPELASFYRRPERGLEERTLFEIYPILSSSGKRIAIIGSGDAAFDYSINLATRGNDVFLLNCRNYEKALRELKERVLATPNISYKRGVEITDLHTEKEGITIAYRNANRYAELHADYLVIATGREPNKDFYSSRVKMMEEKLLNDGLLHLVGDVKNKMYRQISIAMGDGVKAAMKIHRRLSGEEL